MCDLLCVLWPGCAWLIWAVTERVCRRGKGGGQKEEGWRRGKKGETGLQKIGSMSYTLDRLFVGRCGGNVQCMCDPWYVRFPLQQEKGKKRKGRKSTHFPFPLFNLPPIPSPPPHLREGRGGWGGREKGGGSGGCCRPSGVDLKGVESWVDQHVWSTF